MDDDDDNNNNNNIILCICSLFNDFFSNADHATSNERVISEWRNEKDLEGRARGLF
jgi:hypothetical protein